jgi:hypothetical protein
LTNLPSQARRSSTWIVLAFTLIPAISCSRRDGPNRLPRPFRDSAATAIDAVLRANEYRDNTTIMYEPRGLDVEKSIDDLRRVTDHGNRIEDSVESQIESCSKNLTSYREATVEGNEERRQSLVDIVNYCMASVKSVLSTADPN